MFQHQILKHLGSYHVSLQIKIENKNFRGPDWCVHEVTQNPNRKTFFSAGALVVARKLLPCFSLRSCARNLEGVRSSAELRTPSGRGFLKDFSTISEVKP